MPATDMRSMVKLVEEKERKAKIGVHFFSETNPADEVIKEEEEINVAFRDKIPVSKKKLSVDLPDGNEYFSKPKNNTSSEKRKKLFMDNIDEDEQEEKRIKDEGNQVETGGNEQGKTLHGNK